MSQARRRFRPGLWPTLATLILFPLFIRLGFWQLDRAQIKHHMVDAFEQRVALPDLDLNHHLQLDGNQNYRHAAVSGKYDEQHQILLDNKVYKSHPGYQVLTPMQIDGTNKWVLVNRGWVPMGMSRQELPKLDIKQLQQKVEGQLLQPSKGAFTLDGGNIWGDSWPQIIQWLNVDELSTHTHRDFLPYVLLLSKQADDGYVRDWHPVTVNPQQSESYAVQWFSFAAILLGLYIFLNYKKVPTGEA